jgi:AraC-like DNA-binding protein
MLNASMLGGKQTFLKGVSMGIQPRVASSAASGVTKLIGVYGGDPDRIFGAAGLELQQLSNPVGLLDLRRYCDLFEQAARQTGIGSFGLRFGTQYRLEEMGKLGELVLNSPTLGDALRNLCQFFPSMQEHSTLTLREEGQLMALEYQIGDGRIAQRRQDAELSIGIFNNIFLRCFGPNWSPEEVHFEHLRGTDAAEIRALLRAPVYFAAASNAIYFKHSALAARMPQANPSLLPALQAQLGRRAATAQPDDLVGQIVNQIRAGFVEGDASIEQIAANLGFSRAGLYRRLAGEGVDFSALTQNVRRELAEMYVAQPGIAFTELAPLLGYSELSAFSRAFTRWTGRSPARYRLESLCRCA